MKYIFISILSSIIITTIFYKFSPNYYPYNTTKRFIISGLGLIPLKFINNYTRYIDSNSFYKMLPYIIIIYSINIITTYIIDKLEHNSY